MGSSPPKYTYDCGYCKIEFAMGKQGAVKLSRYYTPDWSSPRTQKYCSMDCLFQAIRGP